MGSATGMNQLFRNLCHHTMWKYAILWRFQHESHMILTCEDSYAIDTKSGTAMEYASYEEFVSHPWGSNIQSGNNPSCSIIVAVSNMIRISYLLGEGIVGKVASMENHLWICMEEMNSDLLLQCREELRLQVVAGIKTILLLPVLPLGLVQLGSLDKLSEDLGMVAQLKDLFYPYQYASVSGLRMEQTDSSMTLNISPLEKYSACLEINNKLVDPIQSQPLPIPDFTTISFDQMMMNELLPVGSVLLPRSNPQSYDPISQVGLHQAHGLGTDLLDEISLSAMCNELFGDHSDEQFMFNTPTFTGGTQESDQTISLHDNEVKTIPVIGHRLGSKNTSMFDPCDYNKAHLTFVEEFDLIIESTKNSKYMDFSIETGCHRAIEHDFLVDCKNSEWMDNKSKADERSKQIATFKEEMCGQELESCDCANRTGYLPCVGGAKKLESCECSKSHCCSTGRCADSCLTQCKAEDVSNSEDSGLQSYKLSSLVFDSKGFKSCSSTCQSSGSVHTVPNNIDKNDNVPGLRRNFLKESHISHRQTKIKDSSKPRPRDRQLIQDRILELRELIPNSSKCSVDALLQRTVNHVMFLQSIPVHASKLSQSIRTKVGEEGLIVQSTPHVPETAANRVCELRNKLVAFPLIIENLGQTDQMLVEMECSNYRLFLEIAQAIKRLGLTILKGILENRSHELWAHFIIEVPKGFRRLDIIWPLIQLLQLKL
ncbi:Transcription factor EMB1444 [Platanthera guangdongensis]|uniref:Transcription factor EMB1444 n=1 Tax=Platanthera guangdongensis TaxID=2320717 RepID=A0ABR2LYZ6_9ASPA